MSALRFSRLVLSLPISKTNREWFPRWVFRFASHLNCDRKSNLPSDHETVITFSQSLRDRKVPAWQRLQAVKAIDCYQRHVLGMQPSILQDVISTLTQIAGQDSSSTNLAADTKHRELVARNLDEDLPEPLRKMQRLLRLQRYSLDTERAYLNWLKRFSKFFEDRSIEKLAEPSIREFLRSLAVERNVAPSTQVAGKGCLCLRPDCNASRMPVVLSLVTGGNVNPNVARTVNIARSHHAHFGRPRTNQPVNLDHIGQYWRQFLLSLFNDVQRNSTALPFGFGFHLDRADR